MANARIQLKNMDYYKYRKLIIDGNRDEFGSCGKDVRSFCDNVQTFNFRDDEFDEEADRGRFDEICCYFRQILNGKRVDPVDMRIKSGWWGDQKGASSYSVGRIKVTALKELLVNKTKDWAKRNSYTEKQINVLVKKIDGPGIYVFKHRERQCFQFVGRAQKIFASCAEKLKLAYEGKSHEPLAALFVITLANDWDFYFTPVLPNDDDRLLRILENDIIIRHDCIWPHGLNFKLQIDSLLEISEFRKSCVRYQWPPRHDDVETTMELSNLRAQLERLKQKEKEEGENVFLLTAEASGSSRQSSPRSSIADTDDAAFQALPPSPTQPFDDVQAGERPASPISVISNATYTVDSLELKAQEKLASKRPQRKIPRMGMKGKENVRTTKSNTRSSTQPEKPPANKAQASTAEKSPLPARKSGLLSYPIDETLFLKAKNESQEQSPGKPDDEDDVTETSPSDSKAADRPTALPVKSPAVQRK